MTSTQRTAGPRAAHPLIHDDECRRVVPIMELVGQRWTSSVLLALGNGATRFSAVIAAVDGLSDRMLAKRLRELQLEGLVERSIVPTTPVQVTYALTERGSSLLEAMQPLARWGHEWNQQPEGQGRQTA